MKSMIIATLVGLAALVSCSSDAKDASPTSSPSPVGITVATGITVPASITVPAEATIPGDTTIPVPDTAVDQMLAQFAAAGLIVDKACFETLVKDESLQALLVKGGTPSPETIQKFQVCVQK